MASGATERKNNMTITYCRQCNKRIEEDEPRYKASVTMNGDGTVTSSTAICGSGRCQLSESVKPYKEKYENIK